jgi:dTDP-4-dehydrorhamnose reductase
MGVNHYLTSERFLDQRTERYPQCFWGGNGRQQYADVEAVRVAKLARSVGPARRLREAWERYRLPMAVTEAHHGCTREDQLRWFMEVWAAGSKLRDRGVDLRAVTVWSLFGAVDWNTLLTCRTGFYEPGVFDVRGDRPRPTAIAHAASSLAKTGRYDHPVLDAPGWWRRNGRWYHPPKHKPLVQRSAVRRVLITGSTGTLGRAFKRICALRGIDCVALSLVGADLANSEQVAAALTRHRPWAVINAAAYDRRATGSNAERLLRENVEGAHTLARACSELGTPLVTFSSDLVFDGALGRAYTEGDQVSPVGAAGRSTAESEQRVLQAYPRALMVRSSVLFSPWDPGNFLNQTLRRLTFGGRLDLSTAELISPTYVPDLVNSTLDLLVDGESGIWHLTNKGAGSWYEIALTFVRATGLEPDRLVGTSGPNRNRALTSERAILLPPLESAIARCITECTWNRSRSQKTHILSKH